jgi:hypothetical protein
MSDWISVTDRFPSASIQLGGTEFSEEVLVWDGEDVYIAYVVYPHGLYGGSTAPRFSCDDSTGELVTYWMPLPEPPEGESNE